MLKLSPDQKKTFADAVRIGASSPQLAALDRIYVQFEVERQARQPVCRQSGACCRFEEHGHRLFVTVLEVAHFLARVPKQQLEPAPWDGTGCPFQVKGLCSVHLARPFGCRVYFCDPTSTDWQNALYERLHRQIAELHEQAGVPYLYVEWREALDAVGASPPAGGSARQSLPIVR